MNLGEVGMFVAVGFVPTLIALEMVYRMGRAIGKRGEISHVETSVKNAWLKTQQRDR